MSEQKKRLDVNILKLMEDERKISRVHVVTDLEQLVKK